MANIEHIVTQSASKIPNGVIVGSLTNSNGVLSGFSSEKYFEILGGRKANATYVIKFTTPAAAAAVTGTCAIFDAESWDVINQSPTEIVTWNWQTSSNVTLISSPAASTTYWIKSVHNDTTTTYYISTNGTSYTQVASFTDTDRDVSLSIPMLLGNSAYYKERYYPGTIDLNGCYIEVGGTKVWQGMDYNNIQRIGGKVFDGKWMRKAATITSSTSVAADSSVTLSLANYLPDSTNDYEVIFSVWGATTATSGNGQEIVVYSGSSASDNYNQRAFRVRTRASVAQAAAGQVILPISKSDQKITIRSTTISTSNTSCAVGVSAMWYRRIGSNGKDSNYISNINTNNTTYTIGGNAIDGVWTSKSSSMYSGTLNNQQTVDISLEQVLPKDGAGYLCLFTVTALTGSTLNDGVTVRLGTDSTYTNNQRACRHIAVTAAAYACAGAMLLPCYGRTIYLSNSGGDTSGTVVLTLRGYRRIGTNAQ